MIVNVVRPPLPLLFLQLQSLSPLLAADTGTLLPRGILLPHSASSHPPSLLHPPTHAARRPRPHPKADTKPLPRPAPAQDTPHGIHAQSRRNMVGAAVGLCSCLRARHCAGVEAPQENRASRQQRPLGYGYRDACACLRVAAARRHIQVPQRIPACQRPRDEESSRGGRRRRLHASTRSRAP